MVAPRKSRRADSSARGPSGAGTSAGRAPEPVEEDDLDTLLRRHGYNTNSFLWHYPGFRYFVCENGRGTFAYIERGNAIIAAGDPLCEAEHIGACLSEFRAWCAARRRFCVVVPASERFAEVARPLGFSAVAIGASPYFDVHTYAPRGDRTRKVRSAVNQARRGGVEVREYQPVDLRDECLEREFRDICARWQETRRMQQLPFLFQLDPMDHAEEKRYYVATREGRVEGFLACAPIYARRGWYLEDLMRRPDAANGTTESLVLGAIEALRLEGFDMATLGMALLMPIDSSFASLRPEDSAQHPWILRTLELIYRHGNAFYNFQSLQHYKSKYAASWWEVDYCLCAPQKATLRLLISLAGIFVDRGSLVALLRHKAGQLVRWSRR